MGGRKALGRRQVIKLGASAAVALPIAWGCGPGEEQTPPFDEGTCEPGTDGAMAFALDPGTVGQDDGLFSLGVAAGEVSATGAMFWSFAEDDAPKTLRVWREDGEERLLAHEAEITPAEGYLKASVTGLAAQTTYRYAFFDLEDSARTAVGTVKTAFDEGCRRALTVAATCCTKKSETKSFTALEVMAKHEFDVICHLGDMSYNDGAVTREQYRQKWRATMRDPGYRALLPQAGMFITWDDHEFDNNVDAGTFDPEQLETAKQAFFETLPVVRNDEDRLWRTHRWGDTVEFFVLDSRLERQPDTRETDDAVYISTAQLDWLKEGLKNSRAHFKVLLNSVPMTDMPDGTLWGFENDRWEGYKSQRNELLSYIVDEGISNVWFLSGDFHVGAVCRLDREGPGHNMWEVFAGPGANISPLSFAYEGGDEETRQELAPSSQFKYFGGAFAATLLTFDVERDAVRIRFVGTDEKTLFDQWVSQRD